MIAAERIAGRIAAMIAVVLLSSACRSGPEPLPSTVTDRARVAYYEGVHRLSVGDWTKAQEIFQALSAAPRHVRHATLAKLRLADTMFYQGRFAEATEMYRSFANQHRGDPNLPYARFRVAHSYFNRLPTSWFLAPPAYEMDQTLTQQAEAELTGFISLFPTSEYAPEARRMLKATRRMLFEHELYAADFYRSRNAWRGVAWRLRDAFDRFPEFVTNDEKLAWSYIDAAERSGHATDALRALGWFVEKFPSSSRKDEALARAAAVQAKIDAERPRDSEPDPTEKLDEVPDFRLKLPGSDSPDGDEGTEETEEEGLDDTDEDVEPSDDDSEEPQRLRPPELPELEP